MAAEAESRTELRTKFLQARAALSAAFRAEASRQAAARIAALPEFRRARTVLLYRAVRSELDPEALLSLPEATGKRFVYPRCEGEAEMRALEPGGWIRGRFGIPEPDPESSREVPPEEIDLAVCPGAAFDAAGTRLGMGGGYYDRFLPACRRAVILMAAFSVQQAEALPRAEWDVPMDVIVTERETLRTGKGAETCG